LHTGDLGKFDQRGTLTITGRLKDLIIRGGENVSPAEIESFLMAHEDVLDVTVIGVPDEKWGEAIVAVVVPRGEPGEGLRQKLVDYAVQGLSPYKVPRDWYVATALPTTASGKIQKFKIRADIVDGTYSPLA